MGKSFAKVRPSRCAPASFNAAGLQVLTPARLQDHDTIDAAIEELNNAVLQFGARAVLKAALDQLNPGAYLDRNHPQALYTLPYVISVLSTKAVDRLEKDALDLFPSRATQWTESTYGWRILRTLLKAAFFLPIEPSLGKLRLSAFNEHKHALRDMAHVAALSSRVLLHTANDNTVRPRVYAYSGPPSSLWRRCLPSIPELSVPDVAYQPLCLRRARRERKRFLARSKEWWNTWVIAHKHNTCAFDELGVTLPSSRAEGQEMTEAILASFSDMVKVLIDYFRRDAVREALQDVYLYFNNADTIAGTSGSSEWGSHIPTLPELDTSSSQRKVVNAHEDFPFDGEADFGPWRILVTHEARKALREADGKIYEVYRRKMQELSHGHLYGDNQKKLAGGKKNQLIPLYEAKMTRDSRLVYQIHVVPDEDQLHERQVIRVWAIYNHRQLDKSRMWSVVDHQEQMNERLWGPRYGRMARRREYQQRCAARTPAQGTSQMVIPTEWPLGAGDEEPRSKARTGSGSKGMRI